MGCLRGAQDRAGESEPASVPLTASGPNRRSPICCPTRWTWASLSSEPNPDLWQAAGVYRFMGPQGMKAIVLASVTALISSQAFAQPTTDVPAATTQQQGADAAGADLATPMGHEVSFGVGSYDYVEPDRLSISIHGAKIGGEYTGTVLLSPRRHWFAQADVRGLTGPVTYDGWCLPFLIAPNSASPNGYALDLGDPSPCRETGDRDWYVETRGLVGKDVIGQKWAWSPYAGLGFRHLSNGTTGTPGYRTDDYLYLPLGVTARTRVASHRALGFTLEYDHLLHGWQTTRDSDLGGGDVPSTPTAPAFTVDGFTDVSFDQHAGWALRASARYPFAVHWSVEPYYIHWNVRASPTNDETVAFTVNGVTAHQRFGAYEPRNATGEFGVRLGFRF